MPPRFHRAAFTLLEICLAVLIALLMLAVAVPALSGVLRGNALEASFDAFDQLARQARLRSLEERRPYRLAWEEGAVVLRPDGAADADAAEGGGEDEAAPPLETRLAFAQGEAISVELPAALLKNPEPVWTFWPSGVCEPAIITRTGTDGRWSATYHPLTGEATVTYGEP